MAYVEQTWVTGEDDTAAKNNQVRDNIKDHQHGIGGVTGTMGPVIGIGVTPASDWLSGAAVQELGAWGALYSRSTGITMLAVNSKETASGYVRRNTGTASMWHMGNDATFQMYTAVHGAAGSAISWNLTCNWDTNGKQIAGTVPLPRLTAVDGGGYPQSGSGGETLRMIRGTVSSAGSIVYGGGFSITKGGAGVYSITASSAFSAIPTIIITVHDGGGFVNQISPRSTTGAQIVLTDIAGSFADRAFDFVMIGPP